jgi:hypothetical protein
MNDNSELTSQHEAPPAPQPEPVHRIINETPMPSIELATPASTAGGELITSNPDAVTNTPSAQAAVQQPATSAKAEPPPTAPTSETEAVVTNQPKKAAAEIPITQTCDSGQTEELGVSSAPPPKAIRPKRRPDNLLVDYSITARAGDKVIVDLASAFELPRGLQREALASTDSAIATLFDLLVQEPFLLAVRGHLQQLFRESPEQNRGTGDQDGGLESRAGSPVSQNLSQADPERVAPLAITRGRFATSVLGFGHI